MIFLIDIKTGKKLSGGMTAEQCRDLPVVNYTRLECSKDATKKEIDLVKEHESKRKGLTIKSPKKKK